MSDEHGTNQNSASADTFGQWREEIDERLRAGDPPGRVAMELERVRPGLGRAFVAQHHKARATGALTGFAPRQGRNSRDVPFQLPNGEWCSGPPPAENTGMNRNSLLSLARRNAEEALRNKSINPYKTATWFRDHVQNFGPWDYKRRSRSFENFGNYNYGYVGTALGIPEGILLRHAGKAQRPGEGSGDPGNGFWGGKPPYGDDFLDQIMIDRGIQDRKKGC